MWVQTVDIQNSIRQVSYLHIPREDCPRCGFRRISLACQNARLLLGA
jgi:hypothetical protein